MFSDYHLHSSFSGDSTANPRDQILEAIRLGMRSLCFTDHHDYGSVKSHIDFTLDISSYLSELSKLREEFKNQISVEIGIELGLQCRLSSYLKELTKKYPFDFIIGSSHFIDLIDPYDPDFYRGRTEEEAYRRYFEVSLKRFKALDCYDVAGHLDYVVRYGPNKNLHYSYHAYEELLEETLKTLIARGKGIECNTGGYRYGLSDANPSIAVLKRYRELGGEILTIGSDGHRAEQLGYYFPELKEILLDCGFRYYTTFHQRIPEFVKIV